LLSCSTVHVNFFIAALFLYWFIEQINDDDDDDDDDEITVRKQKGRAGAL